METHEPGPTPSSVCIHSVCVAKAYRRRGVALKLLDEYLTRLGDMANIARALLICKEDLKHFYTRAGFVEVGPSEVVHGKDQWFEMRRDVTHNMSSTQPSQASILTALQSHKQSTRIKPAQRLYTSFANPASDLTYTDQTFQYNTYKLTCPREACGSLILSRGVGTWYDHTPTVVHPNIFTTSELGFPVSLPEGPTGWWLVKPSPMEFENIGFSRAIPGSDGAALIKYLSCAECDLGPLGWCVERGPTEFWVNAGRVGYRTV
jgi:hypothetical protein